MAEARKKILCIEDDRETAKLIAEEFSDRGFNVVIAYDGRVGLSAILRGIPDLVLCDVALPTISGFEVLASMNTSLPLPDRVPFIFLTGASSLGDELQGRKLGADDYVKKPIDFDILEIIVRARLSGGVARRDVSVWQAKVGRCDAGGALEQVVELVDAPTVGFHPERVGASETAAKRSTDPIAKR
ncbi:MAG: response regulator [Methylobacteriaceae bacterium]|nr:response regulator [Methylobacteriaceae bacterium]